MSLATIDARSLRLPGYPRIGRIVVIAALAIALLIYAVIWHGGPMAIWALTLGASLCALILGLVGTQALRNLISIRATRMLAKFFENDATPCFVTDEDGALVSGNPSARRRFQPTLGDTMVATLRGTFADPAAILYRLQTLADDKGAAREDIVTRRGPVRLSVQRLRGRRFLWRIEDIPVSGNARRSAETLPVPTLTVSKTGAILSMNEAARSLAGGRVTSLDRIFSHLPLRSGESTPVITADGKRYYNVIEHAMTAGRRELFLFPDPTSGGRALGIDALPVALLHLDVMGRILGANGAADALLGVPDLQGRMIGEVMEGLGRPIPDWLEETKARRSLPKSEFLRLTRRDHEMFVQVTLSLTRQDGEDRLIAVLSDATELKTLEAQFVQSQKMQAIGQLAGGVAHDFNNLLTAISGHCDLLLLRHDQGDENYADLMQINQNANRAASLVGQLLAFSRKQTLQPEILDVRDTLADLTHLLNRLVGERVTLTLSHDPVLGAVDLCC